MNTNNAKNDWLKEGKKHSKCCTESGNKRKTIDFLVPPVKLLDNPEWKQWWIFKGSCWAVWASVHATTHHCESAGAPSDGACIWRPCHTRYIWTCGCQPPGSAVGAVEDRAREWEREKRLRKLKSNRTEQRSSVNNHNQLPPDKPNGLRCDAPASLPFYFQFRWAEVCSVMRQWSSYLLIFWQTKPGKFSCRLWQSTLRGKNEIMK